MTAYEIAREIANSGDEMINDILLELNATWPATYKYVEDEIKETIEWYKED